jgi:hypothetical protein
MNQPIKTKILLLCMFFIAGFAISCQQKSNSTTLVEPTEANAIQLEKQMWKAMANGDMQWVSNHIADNFQSVHSDGARSRLEELELIRGLDLGKYELSNFKVTEDKYGMVVTYSVSVAENVAGERTDAKPAPRLSVWDWQPADSSWKWETHANLKPMSEN